MGHAPHNMGTIAQSLDLLHHGSLFLLRDFRFEYYDHKGPMKMKKPNLWGSGFLE
jgi:hypothetical protein